MLMFLEFENGTNEKFTHRHQKGQPAAELETFIRIGKAIRDDPNYPTSNMGKFEKMPTDFNSACLEIQSKESAKNTFASDTTFIALAAPSIEGKTQSAFVVKDVLPLYFPICETFDRSECYSPQQIYVNFWDYVCMLRDCALADLKNLDHHIPSAHDLLDSKKTEKFWTAGFLRSLIETFNPLIPTDHKQLEEFNWMDVFTKEQSFTFTQASVEDIISFTDCTKFFLFLDEFIPESWVIFIRNLSRAIRLRCVVANTNTKIVNVVSKSSSASENSEAIWSCVICRLNGARRAILDSEYGFTHSIKTIVRSLEPNFPDPTDDKTFFSLLEQSDNPVLKFLGTFNDARIEQMRPGIAAFLAKSFKRYAEEKLNTKNHASDLVNLLEFVIWNMSTLLHSRKPRLHYEHSGFIGNIGLLLAQSYYPIQKISSLGKEAIELAKTFNQRAHMDNHLYYLSNPAKPDKWAFLTFLSDDSERKMINYLDCDNKSKLKWEVEYTYIRIEEIMEIAACLTIRYNRSVCYAMSDANINISSNADGAVDSVNDNDPGRCGNASEITAAACIVYATRHGKCGLYSFTGINGQEFIKNLLRNLINDEEFDVLSSHLFTYYPVVDDENRDKVFDLENFMSTCKIPYIYGWNHQIPHFDTLNSREGLFFRNFIRVANADEVDGRFDALIGNEYKQVVVECKNYGSIITTTKLIGILKKCIANPEVGLSIVFGTYFSIISQLSPTPTARTTKIDIEQLDSELDAYLKAEAEIKRAQTKEAIEDLAKRSELLALCKSNEINVYRVCPAEPVYRIHRAPRFKIVPLDSDFAIHPKPKLNCILFEQYCINSHKNRRY